MEILQKITDDLEPLGGTMLLDEYVKIRRAAQAARQAAAAAAAQENQAARAAAAAAAAAQQAAAQPAPADIEIVDAPQSDVDGFMNRDAIEGTTDDEVQEFLRERRGFDPTEY